MGMLGFGVIGYDGSARGVIDIRGVLEGNGYVVFEFRIYLGDHVDIEVILASSVSA